MKKVLIVGDIMLDHYVFGNVGRISPEAPVPVLLQDSKKNKYVPGGAGNVAVNMKVAGVEVDILSVIGDDENGKNLERILKENGFETENIISDASRRTTTKLRYIAQNNQQILRVDLEDVERVPVETVRSAIDNISDTITKYNLLLISDYAKGFVTEEICQPLITVAREKKIPILVDVKGSDSNKYRGATLIKPNRIELAQLSGHSTDTIDQAVDAAGILLKNTGCKYVLGTLGSDGMILVDKGGLVKHEKTVTKEVYDVTGAGDTTIAYLAVELAKGADIESAMETANLAAGVQVSKVGTSVVYPEEVEAARLSNRMAFYSKQLNYYRKGGLGILEESRKGKKVVFTNGCFDILHAGHITYLAEAKKLGDILVVGVNSDASVKRLKGEERPVNNVSDRALLLSALESVDYVIPFEEDTPLELIKEVRPDVLVKGGDYSIDNIVGADIVASYGGITTTIPLVPDKSTTGIINRLKSNE